MNSGANENAFKVAFFKYMKNLRGGVEMPTADSEESLTVMDNKVCITFFFSVHKDSQYYFNIIFKIFCKLFCCTFNYLFKFDFFWKAMYINLPTFTISRRLGHQTCQFCHLIEDFMEDHLEHCRALQLTLCTKWMSHPSNGPKHLSLNSAIL